MSKRAAMEEPHPHGAPRWYVGFSTLTTILMTFFITLTVRMGDSRDLGYVGPGAGAFRAAFNSHGTYGVLRGARRVVNFFTWSDKSLPEETLEGDAETSTTAERLIEMPDRDLKELTAQLESSDQDVVLPLALRYEQNLSETSARSRLAAEAKLIRRNDRTVMVCATLPTDGKAMEESIQKATEWAAAIARVLSEQEKVPSQRLTVIGRVGGPDAEGKAVEANVRLVLRPPAARISTNAAPEKPQVQYQVVH